MNSTIKKVSIKVFINEKIRSPEVRVISSEGEQLGVMTIKDALKAAREEELDLVEVAPNSKPSVCRIMDYGKFQYQQSKKAQEAKKSQTVVQVKEVKMRPKTEEHDFQFKVRHIKRFLEDGNKAKVCVIFRGREITHKNIGAKLLDRVIVEMQDIGVIEQQPRFEGRNMVMIVAPK